MMPRRVLIANRGEIAVRVAATVRRLGLTAVAVYSDADRGALHVRAADEAVRIGPAPASQSYLDIDAVVAAARRTGAEAIHPGYGFLSENPRLAEACASAGILFVGPPAAVIARLGDKQAARELARLLDIPVVPGAEAIGEASAGDLGLPLMLKAAAGGGGRGMRLVRSVEELAGAVESASAEALAAFGDGRIFAERYLEGAHHIEVQVMGDASGRVQAVGERECSVQRRHQKVVEECPSPSIDDGLRDQLAACAVRLCEAVGYLNAGSVEFLVLPESREFFFLEVNTRLQVEHPVTEEVAGCDLVEMQLRAAAGETLPDLQLRPGRHSVEFRIYAEDPSNGFRPSPGRVERYMAPGGEGLRIDAGIDEGSVVPAFYDALIAKLVVSGETRAAAVARARQGLDGFAVRGVRTNLPLLRAIARSGPFEGGRVHVQWLESELPGLLEASRTPDEAVAALAAYDRAGRWQSLAPAPWSRFGSWRTGPGSFRYRDEATEIGVTCAKDAAGWLAVVGERSIAVTLHEGWATAGGVDFAVQAAGDLATVRGGGQGWLLERAALAPPGAFRARGGGGGGSAVAPLHAMVERVLVAEGDAVEAQQPLVVVSAMKMEHVVVAPSAGIVEAVLVRPGDQVAEGQELVRLRG